MSDRVAVFRCDASRQIGSGHVVRCLALADALTAMGWSCIFASTGDTIETVPTLASSGHQMVALGEANHDAQRVKAALARGCDLLVVDHYQRNAEFETACRPWATRILVIDDLADRVHDADLLLDQTYGRSENDYRDLVPARCTMLLGTDYALLRDQFAISRPLAISHRSARRSRRVLIAMGSTDPHNVSGRALDGLIEGRLNATIDVVLGLSAPHLESVRNQVSGLGPRVRLLTAVSDMATLMAEADLTVGAAGSSSWERCCLGLPTLLIICAENQALVARNLADSGAAMLLGDYKNVDSCAIRRELARLLNDEAALINMAKIAATICDGLGARRTALILTQMYLAEGPAVVLRLAKPGDAEILYEWQCEPGIRRYFRNPAVPTHGDHIDWYASKLHDAKCLFHIIEVSGIPVGCLRLDQAGTGYVVSILVSPLAQGKGVGRAALQALNFLLPWASLEAEVGEGNRASIAAFEAAGFIRTGPDRFQRGSLETR